MSKMLARPLTALLTLLVLLSGRPQTAAAQTIVFTPQWTAQAQFAGYYVAAEKGFFREAGRALQAGYDYVQGRRTGKNTGATWIAGCYEIYYAMQNGKNPLTQKGARVGIWNVDFGHLAYCMNIKDHLDYKWVRFAQDINLFVAGALDATLAMSYNEYYQLLQSGIKIGKNDVYRFCDHGYNVQEDGVYMKRDYYEAHRDEALRFARACRKGWEWAARHPEETLDIVMKYVELGHIATNRTMQRLMLKEILRLQVDRESKKREFRLRPDMVRLASRLMAENAMLSREIKYEELIDNDKRTR